MIAASTSQQARRDSLVAAAIAAGWTLELHRGHLRLTKAGGVIHMGLDDHDHEWPYERVLDEHERTGN